MKLSILAVALATSAEAAMRGKRQFGYPDVSDCGLDAFDGHTSEALLFCSNILKSGTATATVTNGYTTTKITTTKTTVTIQPSATPKPTPTPTPTPTPSPSSSSAPAKSSSSATPVEPSSTLVSSTLVSSPSPCGVAAYVKTTPAYYFESSGTQNSFAACGALCKADSKCKSFGYGEANCMLFDVTVYVSPSSLVLLVSPQHKTNPPIPHHSTENTNYNPMSPYTFYDSACPVELPVRKRSPQLDISLGLPGGIHISLGLGNSGISSACSCLITKGPARTTVTRTISSAITKTSTVVSTVTTTRA
ncbi:hypothetical protein DDE82_002812 [Stemphylium lycopersici]|nr:hypothetical protein DDE82_002812 [Stemphylium lycopersici]